MKKLQYSALALAIGTALTQVATPVLAQEAEADKKNEEFEVIRVTASGREKRPEEIPYNISTISGDDLVANKINNETDLLRSISGVGVVDRGYRASGNVNSITIRGLNVDGGQRGDNASNAAASVSTYVGNTPLYANFIMRDINRVEVLRGPQGTLYGSSSLGGTLRFIPNEPELDDTYGNVTLDLGQTDGSEGTNKSLDLMLNVGLTDTLAVRGHIGKIDNDGYIDYVNAYRLNDHREPLVSDGNGNCLDPRDPNTPNELIVGNVIDVRDSFASGFVPGASPDVAPIGTGCFHEAEDANTVDISHGRLAAKWQPSESFDATLAYQYQKIETGGRSAVTPGDNQQDPSSEFYQAYGDDDIGFVLLEPSEDEAEMVSLDLEWELEQGTVSSNSSWYNTKGYNERDNGGLWSGGSVDFLYTGWARPAQRTVAFYDNETIVQELRFTSKESETFDWIVGVFYLDEDKQAGSDSLNPGMSNWYNTCIEDPNLLEHCSSFYFGSIFWNLDENGQHIRVTENDFVYRRNESFEETAIYGEVNYRPTSDLELTVGLRWFDNTATSQGEFGFPIFEGTTTDKAVPTKSSEDGVLFKLNASYQLTEQAMIYGTVSEGFRRGGVNAIADTPSFPIPDVELIQTYDKDTVINYEVGVKGASPEFSYTVSGFYIDWQDPQLNTATDWGFLVALNAEEARTYGVETEFSGNLGDNWDYTLGYTYTQGEITKDSFDPRGNGVVIARDGDKLPGTPEHVFNASLSRYWDVGGDYMSARINLYHQGESENTADTNSPFAQTFDSFTMLTASISYVYDDDLTFTLYGKNLTNESATTGASTCPIRCTDYQGNVNFGQDPVVYEGWYGNANIEYVSPPRTIGISVNYQF